MSTISFENFGKLANSQLSSTEQAGRYDIQAEAEKLILSDVIPKLCLNSQSDLLDIGCGSGLLLIPLSFLVHSATGIDHAEVIAGLRRRFTGASLAAMAGNFLDLAIGDRYSAILAYSVVHYLSSKEELFAFADKAVELLRPNGRMLIGDIPNVDRKRRFLQTKTGAEFTKAWQKRTVVSSASAVQSNLSRDPETLVFNDELILNVVERFRKRGFDVYILPQAPSLPFGYTREDVLIVRSPS